MLFLNYIVIIILIISKKMITKDDQCCLKSDFLYRNNQKFTLQGFQNLSQLKFNCFLPFSISVLEIKPKIPLKLDNLLQLNGLVIVPAEEIFSIILTNFNGFELMSNPFKNFKILKNYKLENIW